jgi:hypothetical protein
MSATKKSKGSTRNDLARLHMVRKHLLLNLAGNIEFDASGITAWEELTCVGFNPQASQLEAVVSVKQPNG